MTKKILVTLWPLLLFIGGAQAQSASEVETMITAAETARQRAANVGFEWRWTAKYIKQAREAQAAGDMKKAMALAKRAKREGDLAIEQAKKADTVWEIALPK